MSSPAHWREREALDRIDAKRERRRRGRTRRLPTASGVTSALRPASSPTTRRRPAMPKRVCVVAEKGYYPGALDTELPCAGIVLNTTPPLCQRLKLGVRGHQAQGRRGGPERQRKRRETISALTGGAPGARARAPRLPLGRPDFLDSELPGAQFRDVGDGGGERARRTRRSPTPVLSRTRPSGSAVARSLSSCPRSEARALQGAPLQLLPRRREDAQAPEEADEEESLEGRSSTGSERFVMKGQR